MRFIVVYDANVLYPNSLRDLLIRVAQAGLVQAKWTDRTLFAERADLPADGPAPQVSPAVGLTIVGGRVGDRRTSRPAY